MTTVIIKLLFSAIPTAAAGLSAAVNELGALLKIMGPRRRKLGEIKQTKFLSERISREKGKVWNEVVLQGSSRDHPLHPCPGRAAQSCWSRAVS